MPIRFRCLSVGMLFDAVLWRHATHCSSRHRYGSRTVGPLPGGSSYYQCLYPPGLLEKVASHLEQQHAKTALVRLLVGVEPIQQGTLQRLHDLSELIHIVNVQDQPRPLSVPHYFPST